MSSNLVCDVQAKNNYSFLNLIPQPNCQEVSPHDLLSSAFDRRSSLRKTMDLVSSFFRQMQYFVICLFHHRKMGMRDCAQKWVWKTDSQGLVVMLHELGGSPATWHPQLSLMRMLEKVDVFAPQILQRGECGLEEAGAPLIAELMTYTRQHPEKPICLLGLSNGSRLATWVETKLRELAPRSPVMVSTISGVHFGCSRMNLLDQWGLAKWIYPDAIREELQYGSEKAKELLSRIIAPLPQDCAQRKYEFYASPEDVTVPDLDSSLPQLGLGEKFYIVHGHGHTSLVSAVAEHQIHSCHHWITRHLRA